MGEANTAVAQNRAAQLHAVRTRRFLEGAVLAGVLVGAAAFDVVGADRAGFLYYFFVPVATGSVLFGKRTGILYALASVVLVLAIPEVLHAVYGYGTGSQPDEMAVWVCFLAITAYVVGWVSERGGNRALLQGLGGDALAAVERERKRMAYDIHDGIAQVATTALMQVEVLDSLAQDGSPEVRQEISRLRELCSEEVREIRTMIGHLRPPQLSAAEFPSTMHHLAQEFGDRTGVKTELEIDGDFACHTDSMRICVYRVVQEALSNVERHADASRTRVGIRATKGGVFLTVADDGMGFDASAFSLPQRNGHFGLAGMHERIALLAGRMKIESAPGAGTVVRAHIPGLRG